MNKPLKAYLALEDGTVYEGISIGAEGTSTGEAVFSTGMTGYQEMLSDPSFAGQILTFTYPIIGNYGITDADMESGRCQAAGAVLRDLCDEPSNWRSAGTLTGFLKDNGVVAIAGVDTRSITRLIRVRGVMTGAISTEMTPSELLDKVRSAASYDSQDFVAQVSTSEPYIWPSLGETKHRVSLIDLGVKRNIMREFSKAGCEIKVWPHNATADAILADDPEGVIVSPGPGDPANLQPIAAVVREISEKKPLLGICLGHQLLAWAYGGKTFKLRFGHRGGNHPVKDLATGRVYITSQNHGYAVDAESIVGTGLEVAHVNLNDGTVEGLRHTELPTFSIQYHPEASPGPVDSNYLFGGFIGRLGGG